ncbi:MAG TPA: hypothetical protein PLM91_08850, partial [Bacillota bacterium]|nr:hypothetical protein [Bacillota bacterium]
PTMAPSSVFWTRTAMLSDSVTHMDGSINALYKGKCYSLAEFNSTPAIEDSASAASLSIMHGLPAEHNHRGDIFSVG